MDMRSNEPGSALVIALLVSVALFGITGALTTMSVTSARAVRESADDRVSFYLAEGGLDAAKREIVDEIDLGDDGIGNVRHEDETGTYQVVATEISWRNWRLTSTGTSNGYNVTLTEFVERVTNTTFPPGALSIVGAADTMKIKIKKIEGPGESEDDPDDDDPFTPFGDLVIDGGDEVALAFDNEETMLKFANKFAEAIEKGRIHETSLQGGASRTFETKWGDHDLPIDTSEQTPAPSDLFDAYDDLVAGVEALLPSAETYHGKFWLRGDDDVLSVGDDGVYTFGSESSPATVHFDDQVEIKTGAVIRGHGTLIIGRSFKLKAGTTLDWNGDIIVYAQEHNKATVDIDGDFDLQGNLLILGEGRDKAVLKIKRNADADIVGSVFVASNPDEAKAKKVYLKVDGDVRVTGLFTAIGSKLDINFKKRSNFELLGQMQLALSDASHKDLIKMKFQGPLEMHRDAESVLLGAASLESMGASLSAFGLQEYVENDVQTQAWTRSFEGVPDAETP